MNRAPARSHERRQSKAAPAKTSKAPANGETRVRKPPPATDRMPAILARLGEAYGESTCSLTHRSPFELLVATILSAQCTDARVNMVTPVLFARCPDPAALDAIPIEELESIIKSTGFFHNKARSLKGAAHTLVTEFGGNVPKTMEELLRLPGVARKTANVVLGTGFGIASGVVVDTHVGRISGRLGFTRHEDPKKIEQDLLRLVPRSHWISFSHQLIDHGRAVCMARSPACDRCFLLADCPYGRARTKKP